MKFQSESLASFWPEAEPLLRAHWHEVGPKGVPFEFDLPSARAIEDLGRLVLATARDETSSSVLAGYCAWFLSPNLASARQVLASQSGWYMRPRYRGHGLEVFRFSLGLLRAKGASAAMPHYWVKPGTEGQLCPLGDFFISLGARETERTFYLPLEE